MQTNFSASAKQIYEDLKTTSDYTALKTTEERIRAHLTETEALVPQTTEEEADKTAMLTNLRNALDKVKSIRSPYVNVVVLLAETSRTEEKYVIPIG